MLFKLARKFGRKDGRFEIITALKSFHGRTLGGIAATGQDKIKKGFEPIVSGFRHVPFNDLSAIESAITAQTSAVMIEGIQGEGGIRAANPDYLMGLQRICRERKLLLLMDAIQCGLFRSGCFMSYQRILDGNANGCDFRPDAISMAKSLGGGFPIGAVWLREECADLFSLGTHGTTYGGNPLGCAVALAVLDTIEKENLVENIRRQGNAIKEGLLRANLKRVCEVRGFGLILGIQLSDITAPEVATRLREAGLIVMTSGDDTLRLLPAYNITETHVNEALEILRAHL
jgi:acetylornithine/N-succinyldiaminopimelate aminotransferase